MSRRKTEKYLKLQLQYAEARQAYVAPNREPGETAKKRQSIRVKYLVMSHPGTDLFHYTIHAPLKSLQFFGDATGTELGLSAPSGDGGAPRGFKPAKIHAVASKSEGTVKHAKDSGRPYISYQTSGEQSSFSAPICSEEGVKGVATVVTGIVTAKKDSIGAYGRIWFTPEFYVLIE